MRNEEIIRLYEGIEEICKDKNTQFNIKVGFKFIKAKNILEPIYNAVIEARRNIFLKYGENQDGNLLIPEQNVAAASEELDELMNLENEVGLDKIKLNELGEQWTSLDKINGIYWLIEE